MAETGQVPEFRDDKLKREQAEGRLEFRIIKNDGSTENYVLLTGLKNIFQKQLPKMPKEYIARLVYDRNHDSLAILNLPITPHSPIGGITYRLFLERGFAEIVFCAVSSLEQVKGYGAHLMNHLKMQLHHRYGGRIKHYLTYADNYAVGYFKKQGFTKEISLDRSVWAGLIKDYDGGTLMQCTVVEGVDYLQLYRMLHEQRMALLGHIVERTQCDRVYPGLSTLPVDPMAIPGVRESGWTPELAQAHGQQRRGRLYELLRPLLNDLQSHPAAWPFLEPVSAEEVPSYYEVIQQPMDLSTMEARLEADQYHSFADFKLDFDLIISNCRLFNDEDTTYCKNATLLERFLYDRLRDRPIE